MLLKLDYSIDMKCLVEEYGVGTTTKYKLKSKRLSVYTALKLMKQSFWQVEIYFIKLKL